MRTRQAKVLATILACTLAYTQPAIAVPVKATNPALAVTHYSWIMSTEVDHFECRLVPEWRPILVAQGASGDALDKTVALLSQIDFRISFGPRRDATITHSEISAENETAAKGLNQIYSGMEQLSSGFFSTFSSLTYNRAPFAFLTKPYRWSAADQTASFIENPGEAAIKLAFAGDRIRQIDVNSKEFTSTVMPQYRLVGTKYRLMGYDATYADAAGSNRTVLSIGITYQPTDGFQIPASLNLSGSYNASPFAMKLAFTGCKAVH